MGLPSGPLAFWLAAAAMTALALVFVLPGLLAGRRPPPGRSRRDANLELWREAVADLERDFERGLLPAGEFQEARRELLDRAAADGVGEAEAPPDGQRAGRAPLVAALVALALPVSAFGLYAIFGEPGAMNGTLERHLADKPADGRAWMLLGQREFENERYAESAVAFERAVTVSYKVAIDPVAWCRYADAVGMAQGGRLAGKPAELIARALSITPAHPCALEMAGSLAYEQADYAGAASHWRQLSALLGADAAARRELDAAIARADKLAASKSARDPAQGKSPALTLLNTAPRAAGTMVE
jgi:cytochrome c-type biogenesis protein CcmH